MLSTTKNEQVDARIGETCPNKVDVFFDNVGGNILEAALNHINMHARVVSMRWHFWIQRDGPNPWPCKLDESSHHARTHGGLYCHRLYGPGCASSRGTYRLD